MLHLLIRTANRIFQKGKKSDREHFYYHKIYFRRLSLLYNTFEQKKESGCIHQTNEIIQPLGLRFGTRCEEVLKAVGKPSFKYDNKNKEHNHKAVIVRQHISNLRILVQLQFYNNQLFFIGMDLSKNAKDDLNKEEIINTIIQKYLNKPYKDGDELPLIEDEAGDFIVINDDVNFSICYFDGTLATDARKHIKRLVEGVDNATTDTKEKLFYAF